MVVSFMLSTLVVGAESVIFMNNSWFLKYIAMKGSFLIQKFRNSGRKTAGITK